MEYEQFDRPRHPDAGTGQVELAKPRFCVKFEDLSDELLQRIVETYATELGGSGFRKPLTHSRLSDSMKGNCADFRIGSKFNGPSKFQVFKVYAHELESDDPTPDVYVRFEFNPNLGSQEANGALEVVESRNRFLSSVEALFQESGIAVAMRKSDA